MRNVRRFFSRNVLLAASIGFCTGFGVTYLPGHKLPGHEEYVRNHPTSLLTRFVVGLLGAIVISISELRAHKDTDLHQ